MLIARWRLLSFAAIAALALPLAVACGDDDNGGGSGSDEDYVAAICGAQREFQDTLAELEEELGTDAEEGVVAEAIIEPMETLIDRFNDADPPDDAAEYHGQVVDAFEEVLADVRETNTLAAFDTVDPGPAPADVAERFDALAVDNEDCQEIGFSFSN
jgi:hypothetical protein